MDELRLTVADLAVKWKCSRKHVYNLVDGKKLAALRIGQLVRFRSEDVEAYECRAQEQPTKHEPTPSRGEDKTFPCSGGTEAGHAGYLAGLKIRARRNAS